MACLEQQQGQEPVLAATINTVQDKKSHWKVIILCLMWAAILFFCWKEIQKNRKKRLNT